MKVSKVTQWKKEAIYKEEKLAQATNELNDYLRNLKTSMEGERRALAMSDMFKQELEEIMHKLEEIKYEFEKIKDDICIIIEQLIKSTQIDYNMAMESFKEKAKKKKLGKYYYEILYILVTPLGSRTHTQMDDKESEKSEDEVKMGDKTNDLGNVQIL